MARPLKVSPSSQELSSPYEERKGLLSGVDTFSAVEAEKLKQSSLCHSVALVVSMGSHRSPSTKHKVSHCQKSYYDSDRRSSPVFSLLMISFSLRSWIRNRSGNWVVNSCSFACRYRL